MTYALGILNTAIMTTDGVYFLRTISAEEARRVVASHLVDSAVGHEATAWLATQILGRHIPVNRQEFQQQPGQSAIVIKLDHRPPEGKVLSVAEMIEIGYTIKMLTRIT